jgi:hypothetical protein
MFEALRSWRGCRPHYFRLRRLTALVCGCFQIQLHPNKVVLLLSLFSIVRHYPNSPSQSTAVVSSRPSQVPLTFLTLQQAHVPSVLYGSLPSLLTNMCRLSSSAKTSSNTPHSGTCKTVTHANLSLTRSPCTQPIKRSLETSRRYF